MLMYGYGCKMWKTPICGGISNSRLCLSRVLALNSHVKSKRFILSLTPYYVIVCLKIIIKKHTRGTTLSQNHFFCYGLCSRVIITVSFKWCYWGILLQGVIKNMSAKINIQILLYVLANEFELDGSYTYSHIKTILRMRERLCACVCTCEWAHKHLVPLRSCVIYQRVLMCACACGCTIFISLSSERPQTTALKVLVYQCVLMCACACVCTLRCIFYMCECLCVHAHVLAHFGAYIFTSSLSSGRPQNTVLKVLVNIIRCAPYSSIARNTFPIPLYIYIKINRGTSAKLLLKFLRSNKPFYVVICLKI